MPGSLRRRLPQQHAQDNGKAVSLDEADAGMRCSGEDAALGTEPEIDAGEVGPHAAARRNQQVDRIGPQQELPRIGGHDSRGYQRTLW